MASHQAVSLAGAFTSVGGQLNRLIRIVTPFDQQALFEGMNVHFEGLNRAAARLRMTQDQETVCLTNAVMLAAAEVIEAHHASPSRRRRLLRMLHELFAGKQLGDPAAISRSRATLAESVRALVAHMRGHT